MPRISLALVFALCSAVAAACDWDGASSAANQALYPFGLNESCVVSDSAPKGNEDNNLNYDLLTKDVAPNYSNYWEDWNLKTESNPILSNHFSDNYIGLGVWSPDELNESKHDATMQEWMMNHGLQFSYGFGEREAGVPRLRFDYLWHEQLQDNILMQIEVPF